VDVEPGTANRAQEAQTTKTMINRVEDRFGIKPQRIIGDTAYGTAAILGWIVEQKQIETHTPVWDKTERTEVSLVGHTSLGMRRLTATSVRQEKRCHAIGESSKRNARALSRTTLLYIVQGNMIVRPVNTSSSAVPKYRRGKYGEVSTSHHVMWHVQLH